MRAVNSTVPPYKQKGIHCFHRFRWFIKFHLVSQHRWCMAPSPKPNPEHVVLEFEVQHLRDELRSYDQELPCWTAEACRHMRGIGGLPRSPVHVKTWTYWSWNQGKSSWKLCGKLGKWAEAGLFGCEVVSKMTLKCNVVMWSWRVPDFQNCDVICSEMSSRFDVGSTLSTILF